MSENTANPLPEQLTLWDNEDMPKRPITEELSFAYHGPAVDDGTIDVSDYSKALFGYAEAIRAAIRVAAPNIEVPKIKITRTEKGSFNTVLQVVTDASMWESVRGWLNGMDATATLTGIGIVGGVGAFVGKCVALTKNIGRRSIVSKEPQGDENEKITLSDGSTYIENMTVINVSQDAQFRSGMKKVIEPTRLSGIDSVTLSSKQDTVTLESVDENSFKPLDIEAEKIITERVVVDIERISFDGSPWRFTRHYSNFVDVGFSATMDDEEFMSGLDNRHERFGKGDKLDIDLETTTPRANGRRLKPTYRVLRVHAIVPYEEPDTLPGIDDLA